VVLVRFRTERMKNLIYIDMDGVLADLEVGMYDMLGYEPTFPEMRYLRSIYPNMWIGMVSRIVPSWTERGILLMV